MPPSLETDRLLLRDWIPQLDAQAAFVIYSDADVVRYLRDAKIVESVEDQRSRLQDMLENDAQLNNGTGHWAIVKKATQQVIGTALLQPLLDHQGSLTPDYSVGWHLSKAFWGRGYATEAGQAAIDYGFHHLHLPVLYAVTTPDNHASMRVARRLGMEAIGRTRRYYGSELELFRLKRCPT